MAERFIDVLSKACESELKYSTEDHRKELENYKYILRRALVEFKQLMKEINIAYGYGTHHRSGCGFICSNNWLSLLEMELKYSFIQLVPFMTTRSDITHDDFVSVVHEAERSMRGGDSQDSIHENFKEKIVALEKEVLKSFDGIARVLLREFACGASKGGKNGQVIVCPSSSALMVISSRAAKDYGETSNNGTGLKRWMDEKVFPLLSNKLDGPAAARNITLFIGTEEDTGELSFWLESACPSPTVAIG
ncbi:hypothetical protein WN943_011564 [Citrus x changshan-huyou]